MVALSPGGSGGGEYTYRQLESLWLSAGGRRSMAPTMAAIAEAESGGNPSAKNPSGASGLWQILGAPGGWHGSTNWFNPNVNAKAAVAKLSSQGLSAWTTYTSGAYKKFLHGSAPSQQVTSGAAFLKEAERFDGTPYVWRGDKPGGFDCSGLVYYVAQKLGVKNFPRTSEEQWNAVARIKRSQLQPGDLVFYAGSDGTATSPGHVAIYAGGGQVVQALETGTKIGKFPIDSGGTPVGYGRIPGLTGVTGGSNPSSATATIGGGTGNAPVWDTIGTDILSGVTGGLAGITLDGVGAGPLGSIAAAVVKTEQAIAWFFVPSHWVRIVCFLLGFPLVGVGIVTMTRTGKSYSVTMPVANQSVPAPGGELAPALGIAEVTLGAILLFVAFHNLDADGVTDFGSLVSYFQGAAQRGGAQATTGG